MVTIIVDTSNFQQSLNPRFIKHIFLFHDSLFCIFVFPFANFFFYQFLSHFAMWMLNEKKKKK